MRATSRCPTHGGHTLVWAMWETGAACSCAGRSHVRAPVPLHSDTLSLTGYALTRTQFLRLILDPPLRRVLDARRSLATVMRVRYLMVS
jgi:hypothetical protein